LQGQCSFAFVCQGSSSDSGPIKNKCNTHNAACITHLNCMAALQYVINAGNNFSLQTCQSGGTTEGRGLEDNGKPCFLLKGFTKGSGILQPGHAPQPHLPHAAHQQVAILCFVLLFFLSGTEQVCCYRTSFFCDSHSGSAHKHKVHCCDRRNNQLSCCFTRSKLASCSYCVLAFAGLQH